MVEPARSQFGTSTEPDRYEIGYPFVNIVSLRDVVASGMTITGGSHNRAGQDVVASMRRGVWPAKPLFGESGFSNDANNAFRFRRIFIEAGAGIPFLSSSEIISIRPKPHGFLSPRLTNRIDDLIVTEGDVLISCSGTIGNVALASKGIAGKAVTQDVIRLKASEPAMAGFIVAYLRSPNGRTQLSQASYGSVVKHIEPEHLATVYLPDLPSVRQIAIGQKMVDGQALRDRANDLLDRADESLHAALGLPRLSQVADAGQRLPVMSVRSSALNGRFEGSYHHPLVAAAIQALNGLGREITTVSDGRLTESVDAITRFRKRVYVEAGGIPMLSSKQLFQVDPIDVKQLSRTAHQRDLPEIQLREGSIAVTCSGTIGRVQIIPAYMADWTASQHAMRIIPRDDETAGYLFAWLSSDYGRILTKRNAYGSVILELDREMLMNVPVPYVERPIMAEIGGLVREANQLRSEAWYSERDAIEQLSAIAIDA